MYAGKDAAVYIVGAPGAPGVGSEAEHRVENFVFSATGRTQFEAKLKSLGEQYKRIDIPPFNIIQINIWDPNGNHIHIDFTVDERGFGRDHFLTFDLPLIQGFYCLLAWFKTKVPWPD